LAWGGYIENTILYNEALKEYNVRKFCNFIYSNPDAHHRRDELFYLISKYKKVDSLGRHLHNTDIAVTRDEKNWRELSINNKKNYRFTIACENAGVSGYVSEKIITSLQAHSVPIYWGSVSIENEFNKECFINANKYTDSELINIISQIDNSPHKWAEMVSAPWKTREQILQTKKEESEFRNFTAHIFLQDIDKAKRTDTGTWSEFYKEFFFRSCVYRYRLNKKLMRRGLRKIGRLLKNEK